MPQDPLLLDSQTLLERSSKGDEPALELLLDRHMSDLRAFVRLKIPPSLRAHESASDVVQSVCCEILRKPDRFRYQGEGQFRNWLFGAVLNKIRDHERFYKRGKRDVRREIRMEDLVEEDLARSYGGFCSPSQQAMTRECLEQIEAAFDHLDEGQREVIVLARIVKMPHVEIADELGIKLESVRVRLHRALARLAVIIDQQQRTQDQ